jgi:23S rRNA pseudouridine1911/1915/1917 synthase
VVAQPYEITVAAHEAGERLDRVLAARDPAISRATLQRWIEQGRVTVAGRPISAKDKARVGAVVRVEPAAPPPSAARPEPIPLDILFEDEHLIVLHKPAGLVVHPAAGHAGGTLVNALLHHNALAAGAGMFDDEPEVDARGSAREQNLGGDPQRPGVVHRLDKDTSGVMVVTRSEPARAGLSAAFARHAIERVYEAICVGVPPPELHLDTWIGRHPQDRKRFSSQVRSGKRAVTHVTRLRSLAGAALLRCQLETGRTHQIRVHLSDQGHPLLGDRTYGRPPRDALLREVGAELGRQALHARVLGFVHPVTHAALRFEVEPPADFQRALARLS